MPVSTAPQNENEADHDDPPLPAPVGAYESCPGRLVFIEEGNTDAWISSDYTLQPES